VGRKEPILARYEPRRTSLIVLFKTVVQYLAFSSSRKGVFS